MLRIIESKSHPTSEINPFEEIVIDYDYEGRSCFANVDIKITIDYSEN